MKKIKFLNFAFVIFSALIAECKTSIDSTFYLEQGDSLYNLAETIYNDWNEVYVLTENAADNYFKAKNFEKYHKALISLASVKSYQFDLFGAIEILDSSITIAKLLKYDSPEIFYEYHLSKANIYKQYGFTFEVLDNFKKSISIIDSFKIFQEDKLGLYARMAIIYRENGDLYKSEEIVTNALHNTKPSMSKALALAVLGKTRVLLSKDSLAKINLIGSLKLFKSTNYYPQQFLILNELFSLAIKEKSPDLILYKKQIKEILQFLSLSLRSDFNKNLGILEMKNSNFDRSKKYYNKAVSMVNGELENIDHKRAASLYYELGKLYFENSFFSKSDSVMNLGIKLLKSNNSKIPYNVPLVIKLQKHIFLNKLTSIGDYRNDELTELLNEIFNYYKLLLFDIDNDLALNEETHNLYSFVNKSLNYFYSKNLLPQFFTLIESNKSIKLYSETIEHKIFIKQTNSNRNFNRYYKFKNLISFYKRKILEEERNDIVDSTLLKNLKLLSSENQIKINLLENSMKMNLIKNNSENFNLFNLEINEVSSHLNENDIMVEFFLTDSAMYKMIITSNSAKVYQIQNSKALESEVKSFLSKIRRGKNSKKLAFELYNKLFEQSELNINNYKKLIIIPDGYLYNLSFESLINENDQYLLETHNIEYQYSATLMHMLDDQDISHSSESYFSGYAYSKEAKGLSATRDCNQTYSYDLLCSEKEIESISQIIDQDERLFYKTKSEFRQHAPGNKIIHLSTHACSDPTDHNLSRIYFEDDYITTNEIASLNLNADLAVLSACETGTGQISKGEGVMSLAKSFFYAGCKSTIVSLWSVDDCSTSDIMMSFYKHLKSGKTKDQSLRLAKLDYLKTAHPERRAPYYWAGFILVGNNDALFDSSLNILQWVTIIGCFVVLSSLLLYFKHWSTSKRTH